MDSIYNAGDIVFFRNVVFDDPDGKERVDTRISGHPFLILNDVKNFGDKCYALKITSRKLDAVNQYSLVKYATEPGLRKDSFVNLNKVFEFNIEKNIVPCCHLKSDHFDRIYGRIRKLRR